MMGFLRRDQFGFTLAEIMVAVAIILIGLVAVLQWFPIGTQGTETGKRQSTAVFLAEQKIEQIKAFALSTAAGQGFATVTPGGTCFNAGNPCANDGVNAIPPGPPIPGYPEYTRTVTVQCVVTQPAPPVVDGLCAAADTGRLVRVQVGYQRVTTTGVFAGATQVDFATMIVCRTC